MNKLITMLFVIASSTCAALAGTIAIPLPECSATFQQSASGTVILATDYSVTTSPGNPALPFRELYVIVPPNADASSLSVSLNGTTPQLLGGTYDVVPSPPIVTVVDGQETIDWGTDKQIRDGRNVLVYGSDSFYPVSHAEVAAVGNMREWRIVRLRYYPYTYNPVSRRLEQVTGGDVVVTYRLLASVASVSQHPTDSRASARLAGLAENFDEAQAWYAPKTGGVSVASLPATQTVTDYVILTTSDVVSASTKLQAFVNHKTSRGYGVEVVTQTAWGGGTGDTAANNIRAYLKANYLAKGIHYVLFIGNPSPSTSSVPMKMLWPRRNSSTYQEAPSDYFYADLTGNWDKDGDGFYGEENQDFGTGGIDRFPEVIVGRIPYYGSIYELDSILQKTIDYESGTYGGTWVRNVLLSMKPSDSNTPGYNLGEAIRRDVVAPQGLTATRIYEQNYGLNPAPEYIPCTYATVLSAWQQRAGFQFWWTHGNETAAADVITSSQTQYLDDRYPVFTFQCSCLNAYPERSDNLGYALLKRGAIATNSATRVSWYYPGEVDFTTTDSNASMTYKYASKLINEGLPCGDAHFAMMVEVPNGIWMNHCVFNIYGDPSVAGATGPTISHTPLTDTDVTSGTYRVQANIEARNPLIAGMPVVKWNTNGGSTFNTLQMTKVSALSYTADIPAQPFGTTVYYYIQAIDSTGQQAISPSLAPTEPYHFLVRSDAQAPQIQLAPLGNTGDTTGPYTVRATVTDNTGIGSVILYYHKNGGADIALAMNAVGSGIYECQIPGGTTAGDTISYYILAVDTSLLRNTARSPSIAGYYSFAISTKKKVAILNSSATPPYFNGSNNNAYSGVSDILNTDPTQRFQVSVKTSLTSADLSGQETLILPDNGPLSADMQSVSDWFQSGKTIVLLDTSCCYGAFTGFLWPASAGLTGYGTYWDYNAGVDDQMISVADPVTSGYSVGQVIESRGYHVQFYADKLPADVKVLSVRQNNSTRAYAVYRDLPGRGRIVALGPFIPIETTHYSMIREAAVGPSSPKSIRIVTPTGAETFEAGQIVMITFQASGSWLSSDKIKLEYMTGQDSTWRPIIGAESISYNVGSFAWSTNGLPGSHGYKVRATLVGGAITDECDAPFSIIPTVTIARAKSMNDGEVVRIPDAIVTCSIGSYTYIQDPNRLGGIRMISAQPSVVSSTVTVVGIMRTINGERAIEAETTQVLGIASQLGPVALRTAALGGSALGGQQGVMEYRWVKSGQVMARIFDSVAGLNNIGLLVKVTGKVTSVGTDYFYVDDGSKCDDGSGKIGVKVLSGSLTKPAVGKYVAITGISSTYYSGGFLFRALILPDQTCLQILL